MESSEQARAVVRRYDLPGRPEIVCQLDGTHAAFEVRAGGERYALRQFNPYMDVDDLRAQFQLAELMDRWGLRTPLPVRGKEGEAFAAADGRLWALFPWYEGRTGSDERVEDLKTLASAQGAWVEQWARLTASPHWHTIACSAWKFRRRKSWAWVVPLDRVPRFAGGHRVMETARRAEVSGPHRAAFLRVLDEVDSGVLEFGKLLDQQGVDSLPHTITHGDFWPSNMRIGEEGVAVLDLDCFSYEPRVTDFARAANWYYRQRTASENALLFGAFQERAQLSVEEAEALPLMMCAHDLYYAVSHVLLFLEEEDAEVQARLVEGIGRECRAAVRYGRERDALLRAFLQDA